jgi:hypothetical protein
MHTLYGRLFLTTVFVFVLTALSFYYFALDRTIMQNPEAPAAKVLQSLGATSGDRS